ncbi:MAG: hypothetical protein ACI9J2_000796 [Saprospiraceae bacterium]|jgi:hypothetical protein
MSDTTILILDFGRYPADSVLRSAFSDIGQNRAAEILRLQPTTMNEGDWDEVLEKLQNVDRCITL